MKVTLIKNYKLNGVTKKEGMTLEFTNELANKLIDKGIAVKFGEPKKLKKSKVKEKLEKIEVEKVQNDENNN